MSSSTSSTMMAPIASTSKQKDTHRSESRGRRPSDDYEEDQRRRRSSSADSRRISNSRGRGDSRRHGGRRSQSVDRRSNHRRDVPYYDERDEYYRRDRDYYHDSHYRRYPPPHHHHDGYRYDPYYYGQEGSMRYNRDYDYYRGEDRRHDGRSNIPPPPPRQEHKRREEQQPTHHNKNQNNYVVPEQPQDENLPANIQTDPRGKDPSKRITKKASSRGAGRNTESFDPASTLVRPDVRVLVGNGNKKSYGKPMKHDDVIIVPELFGAEDDWSTYYQLIKEMTELQQKEVKGSEFISWHEGAHLIVKNPEDSPTFQNIIARLCEYFDIDAKSAGTRFNWYKDSADWKAYHHDSAAFNPKRAKNQNITVGVSFGATRELSFLRAYNNENNAAPQQHNPVRMYFPQTNNGVFTFGRDVNIQWKHGVNALPSEEHDGKGRISIILWGLAKNVIEEEGSPPLLGSDGQGPHANSNKNKNNGRHNKKRRNNHHAQNMKRRNNVKDNHNNPRGEKDKKNGRPQEKK